MNNKLHQNRNNFCPSEKNNHTIFMQKGLYHSRSLGNINRVVKWKIEKLIGEENLVLFSLSKLSGNFIATTKTTSLKRWEERSLSSVEGREAGGKGHSIQELRITLY